MVSVDAANARKSESEVAAWTAALLPLVKGKIMLDKATIARISNALGEVEHANQRGTFAREMLKVSKVLKLGQTLSEDSLLISYCTTLGERAGGHRAKAW